MSNKTIKENVLWNKMYSLIVYGEYRRFWMNIMNEVEPSYTCSPYQSSVGVANVKVCHSLMRYLSRKITFLAMFEYVIKCNCKEKLKNSSYAIEMFWSK